MKEVVIVDSALSVTEALRQNPTSRCPLEILAQQGVIPVRYYSFDGRLHQGQVVMDKRLVEDIHRVFVRLREERFPLQSVIPITDPRFAWDDIASMSANNASGFNYRTIAGTTRLSLHAYGQAIDLNPLFNPYIRADLVQPPGAVYDPTRLGTITADSFLVQLFDELGWEWGGHWEDRKDYQHFQKKLS
ncbi:MAG: hypothetical protein G01um101438_1017 [Parcubacteria group bacterium Gr01-1014_38]|nr:MAG: hypothetical protein G01um101438_1017 [Parcubacteria group bacterium Gr01-1014_38]